MAITLIRPNSSHEAEYKLMIQEFLDAGDEIQPGAMKPVDNESYDQFLERLDQQVDGKYKPDIYVPATLYFMIEENTGKIVWALHIRHQLNDFLKTYGGHIGYGVRPSERKKHYGTQALTKALEICKTMGLKEIELDCRKDNIWSSKIMQNNGAIHQYDFDNDGIIHEKRKILV